MIPRYSRPEMAAIWEPANKFRIWFKIEAHACDAQAKLGVIPAEAAKTVWESVLGLFPSIQTSRPAFFTSMADLKPAPPQPITRTFDI